LDLLRSPILIGVALVLAYTVGTFIELLGEIIFAPVVCGVIGEVETAWVARRWGALPLALLVGPFKGLAGRGGLQLAIPENLSLKAQERFEVEPLPPSVIHGLKYPFGLRSELAFKYVADSFKAERSRRWAKQVITRVKDVSALITVTLILFTMLGIPRLIEILTVPRPTKSFGEPARRYLTDVRNVTKKVNEQIDVAPIRRCGSVCTSLKNVDDTTRDFVHDISTLNAFARNLQIGLERVELLNLRSRDLLDEIKSMNDSWKPRAELGSETMQNDEQLCRDIAKTARGLSRTLLATPSGPADHPVVDVPIEGLTRSLQEIESKAACPPRWWALIDDINHLARFLDPVDPALVDPIIRQGEALVASIRTEQKARSLLGQIGWWALTVSLAVVISYLLLIRSVRAGLMNVLEALAIEKDEGLADASSPATAIARSIA
jgi:hypothetical protein